MEGLLFLGVLVAGIWFWLDSARAREMATELADQLCRRYGLQFLDGTAALARFGVRWTSQGLRIRRVYRFDYSEAGLGRHTGHLVLVGTVLDIYSLGAERNAPGTAGVTGEDDVGGPYGPH